jgi:dual specificity MAP kinase phosphatase
LHLPTKDNEAPSLHDLIKGTDFIVHEIAIGGKIYIHCRKGLGRGPTMAIAYLMRRGATLEDALSLIKKVRPFISPTVAQIGRLNELSLYFESLSNL